MMSPVREDQCYLCKKSLEGTRAHQMHFYGPVADYLGMPRAGVNFCSECYKTIRVRWKEAITATMGQVADSALSACRGDNSPDPEPGDS